MNATKRQLKLAFVNADASAAQALIDASSTIAQVESAYWNLVAAWRNVAIQEEALKEAIAQQQSNVRLGAARRAGPDRSGRVADAGLELSGRRLLSVANGFAASGSAQEPCRRRSRRRDLDRQPRAFHFGRAASECGRPGADHRRRPPQSSGGASGRRTNVSPPTSTAASPQTSRCRRPTCRCNTSAMASRVSLLRSQDFCSANALTSRRLTTCPTPPPETQGKMAFAYHNMWAAYFPTFNTALVVSYPIQGHLARGMRGVASEEEKQATLLMQRVDERIGAEARDALQSYQSALAKLNAARNSREAAEAVYASEVRKFHQGESTTFLVLQRQVQLAAGARLGAPLADAAQSIGRRAAARRRHDPHHTTASICRRSARRRSRTNDAGRKSSRASGRRRDRRARACGVAQRAYLGAD